MNQVLFIQVPNISLIDSYFSTELLQLSRRRLLWSCVHHTAVQKALPTTFLKSSLLGALCSAASSSFTHL